MHWLLLKSLSFLPLLYLGFGTMRVTIVARGREFAMEIGFQEPVLAIKSKLEQFLGIPAGSQTLSVSGWELVDGLDMDDYPIVTHGTKIDLTATKPLSPPINHCSKMQIVVKFSAKQITMEVDTTETVRSLKEKIHIVDGTPIKRMLLFFSGTEMTDDFRNLSEYGISESSEIIVFLKTMNRLREEPPSKKLNIVVQMSSSLLNAAAITFEMKDCSTVNELRELLLSRRILPRDDYLFIHKQRIMRENCSLRWHGVENGDCLYVFRGTHDKLSVPMLVTVNNCNYWSFKFKNTVGFINYRGAVVATVPIEQSSVPSRGKLNISTVADFKVERLIMNTTFWADVLSGSVNFSSVATMHGKVTMFKLLKIHASFPSKCDISIFIPTRSVQSICKMKVKV
ncbi:putative triptychon and cpc [Hibiscus syriacus]|uniref:Triptychon and cpc n=1 Tax=Hibiscus syriacus TaxID=106335 RepID=A0A6A3CBR0_HIBSY|nr:putative triptychon and cpc [Hibiscus syriacus]